MSKTEDVKERAWDYIAARLEIAEKRHETLKKQVAGDLPLTSFVNKDLHETMYNVSKKDLEKFRYIFKLIDLDQ